MANNLKQLQQDVEVMINGTPSGHVRNVLCDINIKLLQMIGEDRAGKILKIKEFKETYDIPDFLEGHNIEVSNIIVMRDVTILFYYEKA